MRLCTRYMPLLTVLAALSLQGCQDIDSDGQPTWHESVAVNMALSVAKSASSGTTRMKSTNVEGSPNNIAVRYVIPFDVNGTIGISHTKFSDPISGGFSQSQTGKPFVTSACSFDEGVYSVLAYGRASDRVEGKEKGVIVEDFAEDEGENISFQPENIRFHLKPFQTKDTYLGTDIPGQIADYLTAIAQATTDGGKSWKNAENSNLKLLYKNFINELSEGVGNILPGSAANVYKWVTELKTYLDNPDILPPAGLPDDDKAIINKIKECIGANVTDGVYAKITPGTGAWKNFPSSLGLPDGAAVVRWQTVTDESGTVEKFVPETQTTTIADINNIDRFTFPAEVYYYGNSLVKVSDVDLSGNFKTKANWDGEDGVLSGFDNGPVKATTKTVAMKDPLQYGVAKLMVQLAAINVLQLPDANNTPVTVGTDKFKLTGIIVGGQLPVGFDFTPGSAMQGYSEEEMSFIYDSRVNTKGSGENEYFYLSSSDSEYINTLVLQSYNGQNVKFVLELENNSDTDFKGLNGTVYRGTKFYLVGEIGKTPGTPDVELTDPEKEEIQQRVFTQDRETKLTVTVNSLAKAYNVLPNLLSPRLEMGLELTPQWEEATTTDVIL